MLYSESESAWLTLRADKIAQEHGWPLPIARSEAAAELVRNRASGHCALVIAFDRPANATAGHVVAVQPHSPRFR